MCRKIPEENQRERRPSAQDNIDFDEATPDGTTTLHGTILLMFQQETDNAPMSNEIEIDPKARRRCPYRIMMYPCHSFQKQL